MSLNEHAIKAAIKEAISARRRLEVADAVYSGLRIRVSPAGKANWVLGCRDKEGRARRYTIGPWPETGVAAARDAARLLRAEVAKGADPIFEARQKRAAARHAAAGVGSLVGILGLYEASHGRILKSWADCKRRIESVFSRQLKRPLTALTRPELQLAADQWPSSQSAAAAVRYLRPVLKWAADRSYASEDLAHIKPPATTLRRDRVLSHDELSALLPLLRESRRPYAAALKFMLLTLARREEVCAACWRDIDAAARTWVIRDTKNGQPHLVPLSGQAFDMLRARKRADSKPGDLVFRNSEGGRLQNWDRETKSLMKASATSGWTRHDLRRTGATMMGEMGEMPDIIEAALNHVSIRSQLAATYNRSRYRPQVATALQRLADAVDKLEGVRRETPEPS